MEGLVVVGLLLVIVSVIYRREIRALLSRLGNEDALPVGKAPVDDSQDPTIVDLRDLSAQIRKLLEENRPHGIHAEGLAYATGESIYAVRRAAELHDEIFPPPLLSGRRITLNQDSDYLVLETKIEESCDEPIRSSMLWSLAMYFEFSEMADRRIVELAWWKIRNHDYKGASKALSNGDPDNVEIDRLKTLVYDAKSLDSLPDGP